MQLLVVELYVELDLIVWCSWLLATAVGCALVLRHSLIELRVSPVIDRLYPIELRVSPMTYSPNYNQAAVAAATAIKQQQLQQLLNSSSCDCN